MDRMGVDLTRLTYIFMWTGKSICPDVANV